MYDAQFEVGCDLHVSKPVKKSTLLKAIAEVVENFGHDGAAAKPSSSGDRQHERPRIAGVGARVKVPFDALAKPQNTNTSMARVADEPLVWSGRLAFDGARSPRRDFEK